VSGKSKLKTLLAFFYAPMAKPFTGIKWLLGRYVASKVTSFEYHLMLLVRVTADAYLECVLAVLAKQLALTVWLWLVAIKA